MTSINSQQLGDLSKNPKLDCTTDYTIKDWAGILQEALPFPKICGKLVLGEVFLFFRGVVTEKLPMGQQVTPHQHTCKQP